MEFDWTAILLVIGIVICLLFMVSFAFAEEADELWKITYYCSCTKCCGRWADGYFASGKSVYLDGIACNWLPFGTRLQVADNIYIVEDRGAKSIFGTKERPIKAIDIWLPSHQEALNRGVEWKHVKIAR